MRTPGAGKEYRWQNETPTATGSLRHRQDGTWEARYSYTDELGQPQWGSVYGKTQKECRQKLTAVLKKVDEGSFHHQDTKHYTVKEWIEEWLDTYCTTLKPRTIDDYRGRMARYVIPYIGKVQLAALTPMQVQKLCNKLYQGYKNQDPLSPKTIQNIHGILHTALKQAVLCGIISRNPADHSKLPKQKKPAIKPLMDESITRFLEQIKGDVYENLFIVDMFSGLRQSELLGLQWQDVNWEKGTLTVCRQLQKVPHSKEYIFLDETKNGKDRTIPVPETVLKVLKRQQAQQAEWKLAAGPAWNNEHNLIFTDEQGGHLKHHTVYNHFKKAVRAIGMDDCRFHDLRHSCAILQLEAGCSPKVIQAQLGHYSSAFTMDTYVSVSDKLQRDTQQRMENMIQQVADL